MVNEQRLRVILFYISVFVFIFGLPSILSFALGYKFDPRTFKFTKAGLISVKTQPPGANIYLDNRAINDKTPATVNELLPGIYNLKIELEDYYPWAQDIRVEAGRVTRIEKIILFPNRPNIKQLNNEQVRIFWFDEEREIIYYLDPRDNGIYRLSPEDEEQEKIATISKMISYPFRVSLSPDRKKLLYFNNRQIGIVYFAPFTERSLSGDNFVLDINGNRIVDVFWHSDSYHLVIVSDNGIEVLEISLDAKPLTLVALNKRGTSSFYDINNDSLYFIDSQRGPDNRFYDNLYRLDLSIKTFPFQQLIKIKNNE